MRATAVTFVAPGVVEPRSLDLPAPGPGEVMVRALVSAISAGTELLAYRGELPPDQPLDATIAGMAEPARYPLVYGYANVAQVAALGPDVPPDWLNRRVFVFAPHQSRVVAPLGALVPLPPDVQPETAALLPSMETAVSLAMDGAPITGEVVAIFGQGVVGLLLTALLVRVPALRLITVDRYARRRRHSRGLGAAASVDPDDPAGLLTVLGPDRADLTFELSGQPDALNAAIAATGFGGRLVIGSWYGNKRVTLDLGGDFHRGHMTVISSQVSRLAPRWQARWTKARRLRLAMSLLTEMDVPALITHRFPLAEVADAYALLDKRPGEALQVLLTYPE